MFFAGASFHIAASLYMVWLRPRFSARPPRRNRFLKRSSSELIQSRLKQVEDLRDLDDDDQGKNPRFL